MPNVDNRSESRLPQSLDRQRAARSFTDGGALPERQHGAARVILGDVLVAVDGSMHASVWTQVRDVLSVVVSTDAGMDFEHDGNGPTACAYRTGTISRVPTVDRSTEFASYAESCRRFGVRSAAAFPIKSYGTIVGALSVTSQDHHGFGAADLRACRSAAAQLASILASALSGNIRPSSGAV